MLHVFYPPGSRTPGIQLMLLASRQVTLHSYFIPNSYFVYLPLFPSPPLSAAGSCPAALPTFRPCPAPRSPPLPALPITSTTRGPILPAPSTPATHYRHTIANPQASFLLHRSSQFQSRPRSENLLHRQRSQKNYLRFSHQFLKSSSCNRPQSQIQRCRASFFTTLINLVQFFGSYFPALSIEPSTVSHPTASRIHFQTPPNLQSGFRSLFSGTVIPAVPLSHRTASRIHFQTTSFSFLVSISRHCQSSRPPSHIQRRCTRFFTPLHDFSPVFSVPILVSPSHRVPPQPPLPWPFSSAATSSPSRPVSPAAESRPKTLAILTYRFFSPLLFSSYHP